MPAAGRHLKPAQVQRIIELRIEGMTEREIARATKIPHSTVGKRLRSAGVRFDCREAMQAWAPELRAMIPAAVEAVRGALVAEDFVPVPNKKTGKIELVSVGPNHKARLNGVRRLRDLLEMAEGKQVIEQQAAAGGATVKLTEMLVQIREVEAQVYLPQGTNGNGNGHKTIDIPKSE